MKMADTETKTDPEPHKHNRPRKKLLYDKILKQMEFYFSDANLSKDRFLGELLKTDQYVPLEVFLKFNKLRVITQNIKDIAKALKNSTLLEVSEDNLKVKRKIPLVPYNADERTVYVESIPVTVGLPWLSSVFEQYGPVAYISLPKFKGSQKIKGYAFVEYKTPEDAKKCMEEFTKMGCKLPTSMAPEELSTIKMFSVEYSKKETAGKVSGTDGEHIDTDKEGNEEPVEKNAKLQSNDNNMIKASEEDTDETEEPQKKKRKKKGRKSCEKTKSDENITKGHKDKEEQDDSSAKLTVKSEVLNTSIDEERKTDELTTENKPDEAKKSKPARKRKAKERMKAKENASKDQAPEGAAWSLQVLSKQEWKALRNKYLNIQWKRMKELKASLRERRNLMQSETANTEHYPPSDKRQRTEEPVKENTNTTIKSNCPEQIPGVLVAVTLPEPCIDVRGTKKSVRSNIHVQHVDVKEGQMRMVVRFNSSESAKQFTESGVYEKSHVLCDAEETVQWEKIRAEYEKKSVGGRPERGRNRLVARALNTVARDTTITHTTITINNPTTTTTPTTAATTPTHTKHIRFDE